MRNFKKAFTLIEIILVIIMISLLTTAIHKMFSYKDIDKARFDTCYIASYGKINSFFQSAILQKMIYTGNKYQNPLSYDIIFDTNNQELKLVYSGIGVNDSIKYKPGTEIDKKYSCYSPTYYTKISGDNLEINISPGLQSDSGFPIKIKKNGTLMENTVASGVIYYLKCNKKNFCEQRYKIKFLPKAYLIKTYFCRKFNINNGKCLIWSN